MTSPIGLPTCRIAINFDWLSIEPPGAGDPGDGAVGKVVHGGGDGGDEGDHLLVIDCHLVRMSIAKIVDIMDERMVVALSWLGGEKE